MSDCEIKWVRGVKKNLSKYNGNGGGNRKPWDPYMQDNINILPMRNHNVSSRPKNCCYAWFSFVLSSDLSP